jgi:hypothetical protein
LKRGIKDYRLRVTVTGEIERREKEGLIAE